MTQRRAPWPYDVMRARAKGNRMAAAVRALPREKKREIWTEIQAHAPEFAELCQAFDAPPLRFRVRDGDGWRDVVSPEIVRAHTKGGGSGSDR